MTGSSPEEAYAYLEIAGSDMETAVQLYVNSLESRSPAAAVIHPLPVEGADIARKSTLFSSLKSVVFSEKSPVHEAWLQQGLGTLHDASGFTSLKEWDQLGIAQRKNGPCGVIAAFLGTLVYTLSRRGVLSPHCPASPQDFVDALFLIFSRCRSEKDPYRLCTFLNFEEGGDLAISIDTTDSPDIAREILSATLYQYIQPGGAILLIFSSVATYGVERLAAMKDSIPLVSEQDSAPYQLCTAALMSLLLCGIPVDTLPAYDSLTGALRTWTTTHRPLVGLLSGSEQELRMRIHDAYKFPHSDVFVIHGRDHFTTAFIVPGSLRHHNALPSEVTVGEERDKNAIEFELVHWNGLPPAGPALNIMKVTAPRGVCGAAPPSAAEGMGVHYKPVVGSIDSIIQADKDDKISAPKAWRSWKYEVALAIDDPSDVSASRPLDAPSPEVYFLDDRDLSEQVPWRCRACYQVCGGSSAMANALLLYLVLYWYG
jgi:hypothetical protein